MEEIGISEFVRQLQEEVGEGPEPGPKTKAAFAAWLEGQMMARGVKLCPTCQGLSERCPTCHGQGVVPLKAAAPAPVVRQRRGVPCPICDHNPKCPACGGTGEIYVTEA